MKLARNKNYQTNQGCFQSGVVLPRVPNHQKKPPVACIAISDLSHGRALTNTSPVEAVDLKKMGAQNSKTKPTEIGIRPKENLPVPRHPWFSCASPL